MGATVGGLTLAVFFLQLSHFRIIGGGQKREELPAFLNSNGKMKEHRFPYRWKMSDGYPAKGVKCHGKKVFTCFAGGGGSTMGYKLAGYDVVGFNEIDPRMAKAYTDNHDPRYAFVEDIRTFRQREDLPLELFGLDILDGSPPCSSFSMAGNRESDWGKKKRFREGQAKQVLDDLFFEFISLAERLQPKVVVSENVTGLLKGSARKMYGTHIMQSFKVIGYQVNYYVLDASKMGVPQKRERVFFIAVRNDIAGKLPGDPTTLFDTFPNLDLFFGEKEIPFSNFWNEKSGGHSNGTLEKWWDMVEMGKDIADYHPKGSFFSYMKCDPGKPLPTMAGSGKQVTLPLMHPFEKRYLNEHEMRLGGSWPLDYVAKKTPYIICMSVPPVMMAQVALRIYEQWFTVLDVEKEIGKLQVCEIC